MQPKPHTETVLTFALRVRVRTGWGAECRDVILEFTGYGDAEGQSAREGLVTHAVGVKDRITRVFPSARRLADACAWDSDHAGKPLKWYRDEHLSADTQIFLNEVDSPFLNDNPQIAKHLLLNAWKARFGGASTVVSAPADASKKQKVSMLPVAHMADA